MTEAERRADTSSEDIPSDRRSKPPIFLRMADEGNVPGRPSAAALLVIVAVMLAGLLALYIAGA